MAGPSALGQRWGIGAVAAVAVVGAWALWLKPRLEDAARERIVAAALRHGLAARIGTVHLGVWPLLKLGVLELELGHGFQLRADSVAATWPGQLRLAIRDARLTGPAGLTVNSALSTWRLAGLFSEEARLTLLEPQGGLTLHRRRDPAGTTWTVEARGLAVGKLFDVRRDALPLLDGGIAEGRVALQSGADTLRFDMDLGLRGARFGAMAGSPGDDPQLGEPTDITLRFAGARQQTGGRVDIPELRATVAGAKVSGSLTLVDLDTNPAVDLALGVKQLDFTQLMGASGIEVPDRLGLPSGRTPDLGVATIDLRVRGPLSEPGVLSATQTIEFKPPRDLPPAITRLRNDFQFTPVAGTGQGRPIQVSPEDPDFISLNDVPPLFLRTLLLAEDSAFYGHRGIDLRELPAALLTNWSRGGAARGASTITQQLAKNLFLSRDKQLGRKLQELAITFLLESALGKARILEIYLNIIEWGPDLRGLRPAARHYFGREPAALTPAEMAFLVTIIPGPILYQRSFANGTPGPGLRQLIDNLLAKLRSVDAISEAEYQQALADPLSLAP